jgi:cytochrome bd-type quinol oxidase subunit 2
VAASKKGKKFWIWIGSAALLVVVALGVMAARLVKGTQIDLYRLA